MIKKLSFCILAACFFTNIFALEVNKTELKNSNNIETVEFENYNGPHKTIDSISAIRGIGITMGQDISQDTASSATTEYLNKYSVIHAIDENEKGKLDADIIIISKEATVDHINNLRRIISAYLETAYNYSPEDAETLAVFITVYNAVYRNNLDNFKSKYKNAVVENLSEEKCGLSLTYRSWPGETQIVIPLYDVKEPGLSTIETSVISDSKVVSSMKEDDDKNIESRKGMVDIKEREADEAEEKAQTAQKKAVEEQKKLVVEKKKTEQAKKDVETAKEEEKQAKEAAVEAEKEALENPDDEELQEKAVQKKEEAKQAEETTKQKEKAVEKQEAKEQKQQKKTEEAKQEAKEKQARADKKQNEAQNERKEIAKDQQTVQKEEAKIAAMPVEYGIILSDEKNVLSRLVKFNKETGEIIKSSPVTVIRNRTVYKTGDSYLAIAGENSKKGAIKLVLIDLETLEISAESNETISEKSVLVKDGNDYYCIISENKKFYVGKFGENLSLKVKSQINVKESTPVTVTDSGIVITDDKGKLKLLSKSDLSEISSDK